MDPRDPDVLYASAWQRQRKVWTFLGGGPESAIYKSTDGGANWSKLSKGLPSGEVGRIGMDISPADPNVVYAIIEASEDKGGFFRSLDRGASWKKMNDISTSGNYYQEIICDPHDVDKVYVMDTYAKFTVDGGKTFARLGDKNKHVDNHAIWINPEDPRHSIMGCDGGVYESWDMAETWHFKANMPITQFYKVTVDNSEPFYYVYGGTQDNWSLGGPSRTTSANGIVNSDWFITNGGDGFESAVDPENPNIVYAQSQYGWLIRYDKQSGEKINIKPMEGKGEPGLRWNWDAPLVISPHKATRLYFAANKLFRSEDRGNSWKAISPDLSRQLDRNKLEVMDRVWGMDAVAKNRSTSIYGNIVALDESSLQEDLLYVGTDDGLVQVTENAGDTWTKYETFPGVPAQTYVNMLLASQHDQNTVFAAFNNHKHGDFKPYLLKSTDRGKTWTSIAGNLPERGSVYCIAEDHVEPDLLFAGTEFGVFFTVDGGENWVQLEGGLPTIAVRDIAIQKRENDLVLATFGRSFYVLDDYSVLRSVNDEVFEKDAMIFPVKDALLFVESRPFGGTGNSYQGSSFFRVDNPKPGAVFTYYLNDSLMTNKQKRQALEKKLVKEGKDVPYPSFDEMRAEDTEEKPYILFTVKDDNGEVVQRIKTSSAKGLKRVTWDLRYPSNNPVKVTGENWKVGSSHLVNPGTYSVAMGKVVDGMYTELVEDQKFEVVPLENTTLPAKKREDLVAFQRKVSELSRSVDGAIMLRKELGKKLEHIEAAIAATPVAPVDLLNDARKLEKRLSKISISLSGDRSLSSREFETAPSIANRVGRIEYGLSRTTSAPTQTYLDAYDIAAEEFEPVLDELKDIIKDIQKMEKKLEAYGAPYTPGRIPSWEKE